MSVIGKTSLVSGKPRSIPVCDVTLISEMGVRVANTHTTKDIYSKIFRSEFLTYSAEEYNKASANVQKEGQKSTAPKFFVSKEAASNDPSLFMIGNAVCLSPILLYQQTTLNKTQFYGEQTNYPTASGNTLRIDPTNTPSESYTYDTNTWLIEGSYGIDEWAECGIGEGIERLNLTDPISTVKSSFTLKKNQPFALTYVLHQPSKTLIRGIESSPNSVDPILYSSDVKKQSAMRIDIGGGKDGLHTLCILVHGNGIIRVFKRSSKLTSTGAVASWNFLGKYSLPAKPPSSQAEGYTLSFFPISDRLVIYPDFLEFFKTTNSTNFIEIPFGEQLQLGSNPLFVSSYLGKLKFRFRPIVFLPQGSLRSPPIQITFSPKKTLLNLSYVGKTGYGTRASPILPGKTVGYEYLTDTSIAYSIGQASESSYEDVSTINSTNFSYDGETMPADYADLFSTASAGSSGSDRYLNYTLSLKNNAGSASGVYIQSTVDDMNAAQSAYDSVTDMSDIETLGTLANDLAQKKQAVKNMIQSGPGRDPFSYSYARKIYTPAVYTAQFIALPSEETVNLAPNPQIKNSDVISVNITEHVEGSSCAIVLNNRFSAEDRAQPNLGRYTYIPEQNNFTGVKPIKVSVGYEGEDTELNQIQHFWGFVVNRDYSRPSSVLSTVTLTCEDRSKQLKENFAINLPIYDGWCHLAVIYDLAKEAGFGDDEILFYQDPLIEGSKITLRQMLVGDPDSRADGCFDGHIEGFPQGNIYGGRSSLPGSYVHMTLPAALVGVDSPSYMFQMGTSIWDCMQEVRKYSQWYLYCNNYGNLIYCPPSQLLKNRGVKFVEVDLKGNFTEYQRQLRSEQSTSEQRNSVITAGLLPIVGESGLPISWTPIVEIREKKDWHKDIGSPNYYPWRRFVLFKNPKMGDPNFVSTVADELYKRITRERNVATFGAWGQTGVFPYDIITLDESQAGEVGVDRKQFIVSSISHILDANAMKFSSDITCEIYDPSKYTFDPYN